MPTLAPCCSALGWVKTACVPAFPFVWLTCVIKSCHAVYNDDGPVKVINGESNPVRGRSGVKGAVFWRSSRPLTPLLPLPSLSRERSGVQFNSASFHSRKCFCLRIRSWARFQVIKLWGRSVALPPAIYSGLPSLLPGRLDHDYCFDLPVRPHREAGCPLKRSVSVSTTA